MFGISLLTGISAELRWIKMLTSELPSYLSCSEGSITDIRGDTGTYAQVGSTSYWTTHKLLNSRNPDRSNDDPIWWFQQIYCKCIRKLHKTWGIKLKSLEAYIWKWIERNCKMMMILSLVGCNLCELCKSLAGLWMLLCTFLWCI